MLSVKTFTPCGTASPAALAHSLETQAHVAMPLEPGREAQDCDEQLQWQCACSGRCVVRADPSEESGGNITCPPEGLIAFCTGTIALCTHRESEMPQSQSINCKGRLLWMKTKICVFGLQICEESSMSMSTLHPQRIWGTTDWREKYSSLYLRNAGRGRPGQARSG